MLQDARFLALVLQITVVGGVTRRSRSDLHCLHVQGRGRFSVQCGPQPPLRSLARPETGRTMPACKSWFEDLSHLSRVCVLLRNPGARPSSMDDWTAIARISIATAFDHLLTTSNHYDFGLETSREDRAFDFNCNPRCQ